MVTKELQLSDFLRVSRHFFLPKGAWPRGIPGTQPQAGDCRFRLLFSAQLSCLCPLPSCSNRTPQHKFSAHVQLLIQTSPYPNFGVGRFSFLPAFSNATENTQVPFPTSIYLHVRQVPGNTGAVRGTFQLRLLSSKHERGKALACQLFQFMNKVSCVALANAAVLRCARGATNYESPQPRAAAHQLQSKPLAHRAFDNKVSGPTIIFASYRGRGDASTTVNCGSSSTQHLPSCLIRLPPPLHKQKAKQRRVTSRDFRG